MKVCFVFPDNYAFRFNSDNALMWINHGLAYLSAAVKSHGHKVEILDLRILDNWDDFETKLKEISPQVVGITGMTIDFPYIKESAEHVKKVDPNIRVVVGGVHATLVTEDVVKVGEVDHIVLGEGEVTFPKMLDDFKAEKDVERVLQGEKVADLDTLPFPDRDLFAQRTEHPHFESIPEPFVTTISSRGCMYRCTFCQPAERIIFGKKVRRRTVDNVIKELKLLRDTKGFKGMMIHDDCLTESRKWVYEFCEKYKKEGFTQPWVCQARADHICKFPEMIDAMKDAGLAVVHVGFESGSQRILDAIKKGVKVEQNYKANKILQNRNIEVKAMFMLGFPFETKADIKATVKMIKRMKLVRPSIAFFTPYPGSELYDYCKDKDLLAIKDYADFDRAKKTPKIKGIDYKYLVKQCRSTWPVEWRVKYRIKQAIKIIMGESVMNMVVNTWRNVRSGGQGLS